jgi:hypothetical protein
LTQFSTPDNASLALLLLNRTFTGGELHVKCVALISTSRGVFIEVQGGVIDLVKSVTRQVGADRRSRVASQPWSLASTDIQLGIPLYRLLESVTMKPTHERLQGGPGRPGGLADRPPPWAHWLATFAHCFLVVGTPPG